VPRLNPGALTTWVSLENNVPDGTPVTFSPSRVKVGITGAVQATVSTCTYDVALRYHDQITTDACLVMDSGLRLYVRELTNKGNVDRTGWMTLRCEDADTP
jgi:hypothetical protein